MFLLLGTKVTAAAMNTLPGLPETEAAQEAFVLKGFWARVIFAVPRSLVSPCGPLPVLLQLCKHLTIPFLLSPMALLLVSLHFSLVTFFFRLLTQFSMVFSKGVSSLT